PLHPPSSPPRRSSDLAKPATPAQQMFSLMDWIDASLKYDHVNASLRADAEHAFSKLAGHCSDYHGLCATMGRSLGYPTRITYGRSEEHTSELQSPDQL